MTRAYVIIGDPDARKSSVIRALTGESSFSPKHHQGNVRQVALTNDRIIDVFVFVSSVQEGKEGKDGKGGKSVVTPADLISMCGKFPYVLLPLWTKKGRTRGLPDFKGYLEEMTTAGWWIENIALFGHRKYETAKKGSFNDYNMPAPTIYLPHSAVTPTNLTASKIRNAWGWM